MGLYPKLKGCPQPRLGNPGSATESVKYVISMKIKNCSLCYCEELLVATIAKKMKRNSVLILPSQLASRQGKAFIPALIIHIPHTRSSS